LRLREEEERREKEDRRATVAEETERRERTGRAIRPVRSLRIHQGQRLAPVLVLHRWAQEFRRWIGARVTVAEQIEAPRLSQAQQVRQSIHIAQQETPRQSRGIRI